MAYRLEGKCVHVCGRKASTKITVLVRHGSTWQTVVCTFVVRWGRSLVDPNHAAPAKAGHRALQGTAPAKPEVVSNPAASTGHGAEERSERPLACGRGSDPSLRLRRGPATQGCNQPLRPAVGSSPPTPATANHGGLRWIAPVRPRVRSDPPPGRGALSTRERGRGSTPSSSPAPMAATCGHCVDVHLWWLEQRVMQNVTCL